MDISKIASDASSTIGTAANNRPASTLLDDTVKSFADVMQSLTDSQVQADNLMNQLAAGEDVDVHDVMIAMEQADLNYSVTLSIRNKLVDAYKEVVHMTV